jgi:hypothetical protein
LVKHGVCPSLECLGDTVKSLCLNALAACQRPGCVGAPGKVSLSGDRSVDTFQLISPI